MFVHVGASVRFWGEVMSLACYIRPRCVSKLLHDNKTPYELWTGIQPPVGTHQGVLATESMF